MTFSLFDNAHRSTIPLPTDAENKPPDSSARKLLIYKVDNTGLCGLRLYLSSKAGEKNGPKRVECSNDRVEWPKSKVRNTIHEPSRVRESWRKQDRVGGRVTPAVLPTPPDVRFRIRRFIEHTRAMLNKPRISKIPITKYA